MLAGEGGATADNGSLGIIVMEYYDLGRAEDAVIVPAVVTPHGILGSNFKTFINKTKGEALRRGRFVPDLDPDLIPYWTQNIVCTAGYTTIFATCWRLSCWPDAGVHLAG